jgi:hypothetical protein
MNCDKKPTQVLVHLNTVILGSGITRSGIKAPCSGHCKSCPNNNANKS